MSWYLRFHLLVALAISASVADLALGRMGALPLPATLLTVLMFSSLAAIIVLFDITGNFGARTIALIRYNRFVLTPYLSFAILTLVLSMSPGAYWGEGGKWIYIITYGFVLFLSALIASPIPFRGMTTRSALQLPLLLLIASMTYELWNPGYFSTEESRPAGFAGNSNFGALAANMMCASILSYGRAGSVKRDMAWLMATGMGVLMTQSRSGLLGFLALLIYYLFHYIRSRPFTPGELLKFLVAVTFGVVLTGWTMLYIFEDSGLFKDRKTRFDTFMESGETDDGSAESRLRRARYAVTKITEAPLIGHGTAFTRSYKGQPHNIYLQIWVNYGLIGLSLWLFILGSAWWTFRKNDYLPGRGLILVTFIGGFFSHNILEQHPFLICFGIMLGENFQLFERARLLCARPAAAP
ncbi:MAG: O-antigen ligase family protein [Bdellovibrionales bacterium]|nr:O-antigen ligase family protein [Bdellovibrionales bacterium]